MEKTWKKTGPHKYDLFCGDRQAASLDRIEAGKFRIHIDNESFEVKSKGLLTGELTIIDRSGAEILHLSPVSWYGTSYEFHFREIDYELKVRNNPLVEWSIWTAGDLKVSYGLDTSGGVIGLRVLSPAEVSPLFDSLLFYMILPAYFEQRGIDTPITMWNLMIEN